MYKILLFKSMLNEDYCNYLATIYYEDLIRFESLTIITMVLLYAV